MHSLVRLWEANLQAIVKVVHFHTTSSFAEHSNVGTFELPLRNPFPSFAGTFISFSFSFFFFNIITRIPPVALYYLIYSIRCRNSKHRSVLHDIYK